MLVFLKGQRTRRFRWREHEDSVRRVLSHLIGKELATKINWVGKGDRIPFKNPKLRNVLIRKISMILLTIQIHIFI